MVLRHTRRPRWPALFGAALIGIAVVTLGTHLDSALAQSSPFGVPRPPAAPASGGIVGWLLAQQGQFYRALSGLIRSARQDGSAVWGLLGMSFLYGVFHAAGPGHGKAVISSYLIANEETWRRGVVLSFASALLQAVVAVALVAVAAIALNATAQRMNEAVRWIEVASYLLIALVGVRLIWSKGRAFLQELRAGHGGSGVTLLRAAAAVPQLGSGGPALALAGHPEDAHVLLAPAAHDHDHHHDDDADGHHHAAGAGAAAAHDHDHDHAGDHAHHHDGAEHDHCEHCGHSHGPKPEELAGPGGWSRGLAAIVAVGLRPCSGAILVLVFALAQGLFWAGVAATVVMGLGTAITVAAIATFAVGAKALASRVASHQAGGGALLLRGVELCAAVAVLAFGVALLTGYMVSERMI